MLLKSENAGCPARGRAICAICRPPAFCPLVRPSASAERTRNSSVGLNLNRSSNFQLESCTRRLRTRVSFLPLKFEVWESARTSAVQLQCIVGSKLKNTTQYLINEFLHLQYIWSFHLATKQKQNVKDLILKFQSLIVLASAVHILKLERYRED